MVRRCGRAAKMKEEVEGILKNVGDEGDLKDAPAATTNPGGNKVSKMSPKGGRAAKKKKAEEEEDASKNVQEEGGAGEAPAAVAGAGTGASKMPGKRGRAAKKKVEEEEDVFKNGQEEGDAGEAPAKIVVMGTGASRMPGKRGKAAKKKAGEGEDVSKSGQEEGGVSVAPATAAADSGAGASKMPRKSGRAAKKKAEEEEVVSKNGQEKMMDAPAAAIDSGGEASKMPRKGGRPAKKMKTGEGTSASGEGVKDAFAAATESEIEAPKMPAKRGRQAKKKKAEGEIPESGHDEGDMNIAPAAEADSGNESAEQVKKPKSSKTTAGGKRRKIEGDGNGIKIITWNVAGLRAWVKKNGHGILAKEKPDIVALQETKCSEVPEELQDGYYTFLDATERAGHGGVLLLTKEEPIKVTFGFDPECNVEGLGKGRLIVAEFEKYYLINAYVPNSGRGLVNLDKRKVWDDYYLNFIKNLDSKKPVLYVGDLNVAHEEIDLANPKTNRNKTAGFTDQERNDFTRLLDAGFVDVYRKLNPEKTGAYTFWSQMHNAREKNVGWRLDYFVVSERIMDKVKECDILSSIHGSDHCPLRLIIDI